MKVKKEVSVLRQLLKGFVYQDLEPEGLQRQESRRGGEGPWGSSG